MKPIPDEIESALHQSYGFVLLIKGKAGTGKTTLALEILRFVENPLYISTRVKPPFLYEQFPSISESLPKENIIDATTFEIPPIPSFNDDQTFLESLKLKDLPDFLKTLFLKVNVGNPGTIVIDSWDAIAALGVTRWAKAENLLANYILDLVRQKNYNLILILETEAISYLDYLVDGIVCLDNSFFEGDKLIRELHLLKLRGVKINQPTYLFSLNNGKFTTFQSSLRPAFNPPQGVFPIEDNNSRFSTGIPGFDRILEGGLQPGTIILTEIHPYLGYANAFFMMPTFIQFGLHGRGIIAIPPPGRLYKSEVLLLKKLINKDPFFEQSIRIIQIGEGESTLSYIITIDTPNHRDFFNCILNFADELDPSNEKRPYLMIISVDYIPKKFDLNEVIPDTSRIINQLKSTGNVFYLTAMEGNPYIEALKNEVDAHFVINQRNGKPIFYGRNPRTNLFAINYVDSEGFFDVNLAPIV